MGGHRMNDKLDCFECKNGSYVEIKEDYHAFIADKDVVIRDIEVLICNYCKDKILGDEANNKIDKFIEEYRMKL
jgi:YgiT-type zinc finger domain-containing protein